MLTALKHNNSSPGQGAHLVKASSEYATVAGSIPEQGTYKINQWMHNEVKSQID